MDRLDEANETLTEALESLVEKKPFCRPIGDGQCKIDKLGLIGKWRDVANNPAFFSDQVKGPMFLPGMKFDPSKMKKGKGAEKDDKKDDKKDDDKEYKSPSFKVSAKNGKGKKGSSKSKKKPEKEKGKSIFAHIRDALASIRGKKE